MIDEPQVLIPFDRREVLTLRKAAERAARSESTVRSWCQNFHIGRRLAGGPWMVSKVALAMFLDGDRRALMAYLAGDRKSEEVLEYFYREKVKVAHE